MRWLESQHPVVIALVLVAVCYLLAAAVFRVARWVARARPELAAELTTTVPAMLTPLGMITGLVIVFLASRVWANLDLAHRYVAEEVSALREGTLVGDALPDSVRAALHAAVRRHVHYVETTDWPAMADGHASLHDVPPDLTGALSMLLAFRPAEPQQQIAQQRAVVALENALTARRNRILLSESAIDLYQWIVIVVLDVLILIVIAMVHLNRRRAMAVNLLIFSTAIAACLTLLMIYDRPYGSGGYTVRPTAFHELGYE
jgi:hypothetical protein